MMKANGRYVPGLPIEHECRYDPAPPTPVDEAAEVWRKEGQNPGKFLNCDPKLLMTLSAEVEL